MAKLKLSFPTFRQPGRVTSAPGALRVLADQGITSRTLFFVSGSAIVRSTLEATLEARGIRLDPGQVLTKPAGEPAPAMIDAAAGALAGREVDLLVALGGGAVLDWCRLAWCRSVGGLDLSTGSLRPEALRGAQRPPLWLIPTTCGSGAEAAGVAVYQVDDRKVPVVVPAFVADHVILDSRLLDGLDTVSLACGRADALTHGLEAFLSIVPFTLAKEAAVTSLLLSFEAEAMPATSSRGQRLLEASYLAGLAAAHCSVGVVHALAHVMAARGVSHGVGNAIGLAAGLRANRDAPAMTTLLARIGCDTLDACVDRLASIIAPATSSPAAEHARRLVASVAEDELAAAVESDGCFRTNPGPLDRTAVRRFLRDVGGARA